MGFWGLLTVPGGLQGYHPQVKALGRLPWGYYRGLSTALLRRCVPAITANLLDGPRYVVCFSTTSYTTSRRDEAENHWHPGRF